MFSIECLDVGQTAHPETNRKNWVTVRQPTNHGQWTTDNILIEHAYIGLGSNLGDRAAFLLLGVRGMFNAGLRPLRLSRIYATAPISDEPQPDFLNMVAELDGSMLPSPQQLMARLLRIEYALGRRRDVLNGPRTIDLDLLLYKTELSATDFLTLPHPRMHLRRFVLEPLNELCPALIHPKLGLTVSQLLEKAQDKSKVEIWDPARIKSP